jgi:hypothetical protein
MDDRRSVSHPLAATPSQFPKLGAHTTVQRLAAQAGVELGPAGQTVPHAPQLVGLPVVSTHRPPQRVVGGRQLSEHAPIEQLCMVGHALPQVPQ